LLLLINVKNPIFGFSRLITEFLNSKISYDRIQNFLSTDDIDTSYIHHDQHMRSDISLKIQNGTFKWIDENEKPRETAPDLKKKKAQVEDGEEMSPMKGRRNREEKDFGNLEGVKRKPEVILKDINMEVKHGAFIAILGEYTLIINTLTYSWLVLEAENHHYSMHYLEKWFLIKKIRPESKSMEV